MERSTYFVKLFKPQFAELVSRGEKRQTVRPTPKRMPQVGDDISLRAWSGKPYRSKQRLLAEGLITQVVTITITETAVLLRPTQKLTVHVPREKFAADDGFSSWEAMRDWFKEAHGLPFDGILISWEIVNSDERVLLASLGI